MTYPGSGHVCDVADTDSYPQYSETSRSDNEAEDKDQDNAPPPPLPTSTEKKICELDKQICDLSEGICQNSGNKFDTWWYKLLDGHADSEMDFGWVERGESSLQEWEEHVMSGNFYDRVPYTKILAERHNPRVVPFFREEFLCLRKGFSVLRAEWRNTLHNGELKKGHPVREEWEGRKDVEKGGGGKGFDVAKWEEAIKKDEELRWERRRLALKRRALMEAVAEEEGGWEKSGEASIENWWVRRPRREFEEEGKEKE